MAQVSVDGKNQLVTKMNGEPDSLKDHWFQLLPFVAKCSSGVGFLGSLLVSAGLFWQPPRGRRDFHVRIRAVAGI